jgi:hypothetical protein
MGAMTTKRPMRVKPGALPLRPEELVQVRALLAKGDPRPDLDAGEVARRLGLSRRTVLDYCGLKDGFPNAWKPCATRVRIPARDVDVFCEKRRMALEGAAS